MAELNLEDGMKRFVEEMEYEINGPGGWGMWLTEGELREVMDAVHAFAAEEVAYLTKAWDPENQDRLENRIRALTEKMMEDATSNLDASASAEDIDAHAADIFKRMRINVIDSPDYDPDSAVLMGEILDNETPVENGAVQIGIRGEDMDFLVSYPVEELDGINFEDDHVWMEAEMSPSAHDDDENQGGPEAEGQSGASVIMAEEENGDNNVARSVPASQQNGDENMADHDIIDEDVAEDVLGDAYMADVDLATGKTPSEGPDVDSLAPPSDDEEMDTDMADEEDEETNDSDYVEGSQGNKSRKGKGRASSAQPSQGNQSDKAKGKAPGPSPQPSHGSRSMKGKGRASNAPSCQGYKNNDLWDVVLDVNKPNGRPVGYICKLPGCNSFQGKWHCRRDHYAAKHPEEWFALTGRRAKVHRCLVDGCGWSTKFGAKYLRRHMRNQHGDGGPVGKK